MASPLKDLIDAFKEGAAALPEAIQQLQEEGLKALQPSEVIVNGLPAEVKIFFRKQGEEFIPALDGEETAEILGTYRLVSTETIRPKESKAGSAPADPDLTK